MRTKQNDTKLHLIILMVDLIGTIISTIFAFYLRYKVLLGTYDSCDQIWILWIILLVTVLVDIIISPVYDFINRGFLKELLDILKRQIVTTILVIVILYLAHTSASLSRLVFGFFAITSVILLWINRLLLKWYFNTIYKDNTASVKMLLVCEAGRMDTIANGLELFGDWEKTVSNSILVDSGDFYKALEFVTHNEVDEVFVSTPRFQETKSYKEFLSELVSMGIKVDIDINQFELDIPGHKYLDEVGHFAVVSISRNVIGISRRMVKRAFDIVGGLIGFIICLFVGIVLGPIIKMDSPGPIIFTQKRVGRNGRIFDFYKFRSMYIDAEVRKKELLKKNEVEGLMFKIEDDPRITKVGKFIRKTSIDELPQFWNVIKGDMSLVGTRPPTIDEYERYEPKHKARLAMRPGITGLWQISGRSDIKDFEEVVKLDMKYIDNWSFELDIKILLKTIGVVFTGKGSK